MAKKASYIDTSAFIAFFDRSDTFHPLFQQLFSDPENLVTSSIAIAEGQGWFLRRYDSAKAIQFLGFIEALTPLKIEPVDSNLISSATIWLKRFSDHPLTLVDAVGIEIMKRNTIEDCWSTDRHLSLGGAHLAIWT